MLSPYPQSLSDVFLILYGVVLGLIPTLVIRWLDRKKSSLQDSETSARTALAQVNAQSIVIRDSIATGEGMSKMLTTMIEAGDTIRELQEKVFQLEQDALELRIARYDVKKLKGLLDAHEISYSEADRPGHRKSSKS